MDSDRDVQWRYSFSVAETILVQAMSDNQWKSYFICKRLFFNHIVYKAISTYHLKTIVLWKCESVPSDIWDHNLGRCVILIIDELIHAFASHHLPHYFIQEQNLLQNLPSESVTEVAKELLQLREELMDDRNLGRCFITLMDYQIHNLGSRLLSHYFEHLTLHNVLPNMEADAGIELFEQRARLANELCLRDPNKYPCYHGMFSLPFLFWAQQYRKNKYMQRSCSRTIGWWSVDFLEISFHLVKLISDVTDNILHFDLYLKMMYIKWMNDITDAGLLKPDQKLDLNKLYIRLALALFNKDQTNFQETTGEDISLTKLESYYDWNYVNFSHNVDELCNQVHKNLHDTPVVNQEDIIPDLHFERDLKELYLTLAGVILDTALTYKECMIHELRQVKNDINCITEKDKEQFNKITNKFTMYFSALISIVESQMDELKTGNYSPSEYLHILQIVIGDKLGRPPNVTRFSENIKDHEEILKRLPILLTGCYGIFLQKVRN